ncbi:hypothetical protein [Frankia sp. Cas4]|uniref:tetratricopeptide repeat protein n=1 Tax=Frankia sp. Cas4 TaxID=3073927 RepID=UPI002AD4B368|nr:hypothetical protein [Frankia sp. Cas4]
MTQAEPRPKAAARPHDPLAVALANASLFGGGYLMLGRGQLAVVVTLITAELLIIFASVAQTLWFGIVVLLWWVAVIAHGWYLAGGRPRRGRIRPDRSRRQGVIAFALVLPVLLAFGFLRFTIAQIEGDVAAAHRTGDCPRAEAATARVSPAHRMVAVSPVADGENMVKACALLRPVAGDLDAGRAGDTAALDTGFRQLSTILAELPGHENMVQGALDRFLDGLPTKDPCNTVKILTWLAARPPGGNGLDRAAQVVPQLAPAALVDCGNTFLAAGDWENARAKYQQLLDQYPGHNLAAKAREGIQQANQKIEDARIRRERDAEDARIRGEREAELATLRRLLESPDSDQPAYCSAPVPYAAAPSGGPNRALIVGNKDYVDNLPAEWRTDDVTTATRVLCVGNAEFGAAVATCQYQFLGISSNVTFYRVALRVRVYELRTGRLVTDTRVEISGTSCPDRVGYDTKQYVSPSDSQIQAAFRPLISP